VLALAHLDRDHARAGRGAFERGGRVEHERRRPGLGSAWRRRRAGAGAGEQRGQRDCARRPARARQLGALAALASLGLAFAAGAKPPAPAPGPVDVYAVLPELRGSIGTDFVEPGDTLLDVAARHRLGFEALSRLNPGIDPWIPDPGTVVRLPTSYLLPQVEPNGIVVNVPEMRMYDFTVEAGPEVLAVAIGDAEDPTPVGEFKVGRKRIDPEWRVPASIRAAKPELPAVVPPGPDNPLGTRWLTIGNSSYGLHGTNVRWSIGRIATHGCVRLYEEDVIRLYDRTREGTPLRLLYQPYKWGRAGDQILLEAHPDVYAKVTDPVTAALELPRSLGLEPRVDVLEVRRVIERADGVPTRVGTLPQRETAETAYLEMRFWKIASDLRAESSAACAARRASAAACSAAVARLSALRAAVSTAPTR
jgi:L,D-transpeptidase ErfK/SrfK